MTQPYRAVGERDGDKYLLEATAEIRDARPGEWQWVLTETGPVRAPVCRPIAKEPEPEEPWIYGVGCHLCNGFAGPQERTHVCKTCYEEAVAESDTLQKERDKLMRILRDERRKSGEMLAILQKFQRLSTISGEDAQLTAWAASKAMCQELEKAVAKAEEAR